MNPLRILHTEAATDFGGQEHRIYKEMLAMRERGHHMELVCQPDAQLGQRLKAEGFPVHCTYMDGKANFLRSVSLIRRVLKEGGFDVVNTHSRRDALIGGLAGRLAGTPLIVRTRHLASPIHSLLSYTWLPNRVVTVSDHVRDMVIAKGVDPDKVQTIYSPIQPVPAGGASGLRQELSLAQDDVVVICVAVLREKKGHVFLLETMLPLFEKYDKLHWVVVGDGSPVFERLQSLIGAHGLQGRVHLLGYRRDVYDLLRGSDIFALATEQEASGTVYVEAQMCGLPVIGTHVGGVAEMFIDGETGFLVESGDAEALRDRLEALIADPALRRQMGDKARAWLEEEGRFSLQRLVGNTEATYRRWLEALRK